MGSAQGWVVPRDPHPPSTVEVAVCGESRGHAVLLIPWTACGMGLDTGGWESGRGPPCGLVDYPV